MSHECHTLPDAARHLRALADELDAMQQALTLPFDEYTISTAHNKLRAVVGADDYIAITPPTINFHSGRDPMVGEWAVYCGKKTTKGKTLAATVNAVLAEYGKDNQPAETVAAVEGVLAEAMESNIPF